MKIHHSLTIIATLLCFPASLLASNWSQTEFQYQYGDLKEPFSEEDISTTTLTFQHASGWDYGENFFFVDWSRSPYNDELYGEWYPFFSSKSIFDIGYFGAIRDIGLVTGLNFAPEVNSLKYLPGLQINWNMPGASFFNTLFTAYIDDSRPNPFSGLKEEDSYMFDIAFQFPFDIGPAKFSIEGHAEYVGEREYKNADGKSNAWILAQPQIRWDAGNNLFNKANLLYLGFEYQYWKNKLGTDTTESAAQFLAVWVL